MSSSRLPRIAVAGETIWQQTHSAGALIPAQISGAALTAMILAAWDVPVSLVSLVGDDEAGEHARSGLVAAGVDLAWLTTRPGQSTAQMTVATDNQGVETVIDTVPGPRLARGDRLDIYAIFGCALVLLDLDDFALRQFLVDLPAHTVPTTRLLGTLSGLATSSEPERLRVTLAHDAIVGTDAEFLALTGAATLDEGLMEFQDAMRISNLRAAMLLQPTETTILTPAARSNLHAAVHIPLGGTARAGLLAGMAYGMVQRWPWERVVPFATMTAMLTAAKRSDDAESPSPSLEEISRRLSLDPATLEP
jgi:sugar/nucleoside kinase (ribokinase family)